MANPGEEGAALVPFDMLEPDPIVHEHEWVPAGLQSGYVFFGCICGTSIYSEAKYVRVGFGERHPKEATREVRD